MIDKYQKVKLGIIARADNRGLGIQSWEFYRHLKPFKTLVLQFREEKNFPERFKNARIANNIISQQDIDWLLDGIDVLVSFETFYNNNILKQAKDKGIKTILQINWEWYDGEKPDLIIAPSLWHFEELPDPKVYLPVPINRKVLPFKLRKKAKIFLHNAGNLQAGYDRNGTDVFLEAIPFIKSNIKIIIKSQVPIKKVNDNRVEYIINDAENYWDGWVDADVLVYPRRYGGLSLALNEAMSLGIVPLMTDMQPQNEFLPPELLIKPKEYSAIRIKQVIEKAEIEPIEVAKKIDKIANKDISKYSNYVNNIAEAWSWKTLLPKYKKLCQPKVII